MEFDVELVFESSLSELSSSKLPQVVEGAVLESRSVSRSALRTGKSAASEGTMSAGIRSFIESLGGIREILTQHECNIRVGAFYNVNEFAFASLTLSKGEIKELCDLNLGLEVEVYPVSNNES